jgi:hypothetical protein
LADFVAEVGDDGSWRAGANFLIAQRASDQNRTLSLFNLVRAWLRLAEQVFRPEATTAKAKQ